MTGAPAAGQWLTPDDLARAIGDAGVTAGRLLLCTDFDGSLAPITRHMHDAHALGAASDALCWLSRKGAGRSRAARCATRVAVVTARDSDDVINRVRLGPEAIVVGNSGLEHWSRGRVVVEPSAARWLPNLDRAEVALRDALEAGRCPDGRIERKRCGLALHTRGAHHPGIETEAASLAAGVAAQFDLILVSGKRAVEIRLPVDCDKGKAVANLRRGAWAEAALCTAGDDHGDVPMLRLAAELGALGVAVAVADEETPTDVVEAATVRVDGPWEWAATLGLLAGRLAGDPAAS